MSTSTLPRGSVCDHLVGAIDVAVGTTGPIAVVSDVVKNLILGRLSCAEDGPKCPASCPALLEVHSSCDNFCWVASCWEFVVELVAGPETFAAFIGLLYWPWKNWEDGSGLSVFAASLECAAAEVLVTAGTVAVADHTSDKLASKSLFVDAAEPSLSAFEVAPFSSCDSLLKDPVEAQADSV